MRARHKVAIGGLSSTVAGLATAMFVHWEGVNYTAKHLAFDPPGVITVCGGVTNYDIPDLKPGMKFTPQQCRDHIEKLVPRYAAPLQQCVNDFDKMPPHRQAALISFAINLGPSRVCNTSIAANLNAGRVKQACDTMRYYVNANGKYLQGLANRRNDPIWGERAWCMRED